MDHEEEEERSLRVSKAIVAGLAGALTTAWVLTGLRAFGVTSMNLELMLGSMMTARIDRISWILGLAMHLGAGMVLGILYALVMELLGRSGWLVGYLISCVHAIISGLLMPFTWGFHPLVRSGRMASPGAFASSLGLGAVILYVMQHLVFGLVVGSMYAVAGKPDPVSLRTSPRRRPSALHRI